jgi:hypothetical protein
MQIIRDIDYLRERTIIANLQRHRGIREKSTSKASFRAFLSRRHKVYEKVVYSCLMNIRLRRRGFNVRFEPETVLLRIFYRTLFFMEEKR